MTDSFAIPPAAAPANRSKAVAPDSEQVRQHIHALQKRVPDRVAVRTLGLSGQGRPIDAVTLTDASVNDTLKQNVLILAGQHGNEESARSVALALMDELVAEAHRDTLRQQRIVVMPNVNPDGAEADSYGTPDGVRPNLDHGPGGPTIPEARAVAQVAAELTPDAFVDLHARGHAGCSYDMVLYPPTRPDTEDDNIFHAIAADMTAAGERAGLPHVTHPLSWWRTSSGHARSTTALAYQQFKSIVMLTESTEHDEVHYPRDLTARVGVARLQALLAYGNRRHPKCPYPGYPNQLVLGMWSSGVVALGATAAARRHSRVGIWRQGDRFHKLRLRLPEEAMRKTLAIEYDGPTLETGVGLMIRAAGRHAIASVRRDGRPMSPGDADGYFAYHDEVSTFVIAAVPVLGPGRCTIDVEFE